MDNSIKQSNGEELMRVIKLSTALLGMAMGLLTAQNLNAFDGNASYELRSQYPEPITPFKLTYSDIKELKEKQSPKEIRGVVRIEFEIDKQGNVINPLILDTFNIGLSDLVLDRVRKSKYHPAMQNGVPVIVKYELPIRFE
jgi:hypothetical protein